MTKIITDIHLAVKEIVEGNAVGLPTETVYGLGANALDEKAVLKIYEAKERPVFNPTIVHVSDKDEFEKYAEDIPAEVYVLAEKFSPGPITFVLKKKNIIPYIVTAGNDSVGLRIPSHKIFREVLKETKLPLAAPSANRSGRISPTSAEDVLHELDGRIKFILDGGKSEVGIESTVIGFFEGKITILRPGFVTKEEIEKTTGKTTGRIPEKLISPGMLRSHYAPHTPLYIVRDYSEGKTITDKKNIGILDFSKYKSLQEIALNLFSDLRRMDSENYDIIICKKVENKGLGIAINDRLRRATYKFSMINE